jgi:acetoin utilization deacetylase AcuC-like enzyme
MELLKYNPRVMYIDIDIHHGDGVEEAFYDSDRVLTVSFHMFGKDFFPGTGHVFDIGTELGKYYAVNVPLREGMTDDSFIGIFKPIIEKLIAWFRPSAILLQCGADSLVADRLGCFNLSTHGHGECVQFVKSFGIPLLVTGGGGYIKTSVARCWTWETAVLLGQDIKDQLPEDTDYYNFFRPTYRLHLEPDKKTNKNTAAYLGNLQMHVFENIRHLAVSPSVQMQELPPRELILSAPRNPPSMTSVSSQFLARLEIPEERLDGEEADT